MSMQATDTATAAAQPPAGPHGLAHSLPRPDLNTLKQQMVGVTELTGLCDSAVQAGRGQPR